MGLFDKIKDNAKTISMKAIESTREYEEDELAAQQILADASNSVPVTTDTSDEPDVEPEKPAPAKETKKPAAEKVEVTVEKNTKVEPELEKSDDTDEVRYGKDDEKKSEPKPQKSRITEVPKSSLTGYTPSYKEQPKTVETERQDPKPKEPAKAQQPKNAKFIDVAPKKSVDPVKEAMFARERAALSALSNQRLLNGTVALYITQHLNFKTRVFINRIEYSGSFGKNVLPIEQVAWVKLRHAGTGVIIETAEGKRVVMVVKPKDRLEFAEAVLKVQAMQPKREKFKDENTVRIDQLEKFSEGVEELEKLAKLLDKGILTQDEFNAKKKQILGI